MADDRHPLSLTVGRFRGFSREGVLKHELESSDVVYPRPCSGQGGLSELTDAWKAGLGFRKTFVDHGQQRDLRERLAQTARRAELEGHPQEIRRRRIEISEGVAGHRS